MPSSKLESKLDKMQKQKEQWFAQRERQQGAATTDERSQTAVQASQQSPRQAAKRSNASERYANMAEVAQSGQSAAQQIYSADKYTHGMSVGAGTRTQFNLPQQPVHSDQMLDNLTDKLASRLKKELQGEVEREHRQMIEQQAQTKHSIEGYLTSELEQHTCPKCFELMAPPDRVPILLFPCGHSFCTMCMKSPPSTCPLCKQTIQSAAVNQALQNIIVGFLQKKSAIERGEMQINQSLNTSNNGLSPIRQSLQSRGGSDGVRSSLSSSHGLGLRSSFEASGSDFGHLGPDEQMKASKYMNEAKTLSMRRQVMTNQLQELEQAEQKASRAVESCKLVQTHMGKELEQAQQRLAKAKEEVEFIEQQLQQQQSKEAQCTKDADSCREQRILVQRTLQNLTIEHEKAILLARNFVPDFQM